jgi:hypothetical protein
VRNKKSINGLDRRSLRSIMIEWASAMVLKTVVS